MLLLDGRYAVREPPPPLATGQGSHIAVGNARTDLSRARVLLTAAAIFTAAAAALAMDGLAGL